MTLANVFHFNRCEWCGFVEAAHPKKYKDAVNFRFVEALGMEHCICADCYERLQ
jgi:hypothetical protein